MTDHDAREALAQAAERIFDFANEPLRQPSPKSEQDFTDPANYWHRAALASLPAPQPPEQCANIAQKSEQPPASGGDAGVTELVAMLSAATPNELGGGDFDHSPEEIGVHVMEHYRSILAALANHSPDAGGVGEEAVETAAAAFAKVFYGPGFDAFHNPEAFDLVMTAMSAALNPADAEGGE